MVAVRLADLLAGLSRLADLGFGLPTGTALRSCVLATRLARSLDLPESEVQAAYYTSLLHHVGCVGYAHETARLLGDELVVNEAAGRTDAASVQDLFATFLPALTRGRPGLERARLVLSAVARGNRWGDEFTATACELGRDSARRLELPDAVQSSLFHVYDMWHGKGRPGELHGDDIPVAARVARLAGLAVLFEQLGGSDLAVRAVEQRAGGMLDPSLAARFSDHAAEWLADLAATDPRLGVLHEEPKPHVTVTDPRHVAELFGDIADLKSPCFLGHARGVSTLAAGAGARLGLPDATRWELEVAGLLHDVGRVAVSNAVWDKPGPLDADEWEHVRLHPYHSERILAGSEELVRLAPLVGRHHERLDGTGYHRGCKAEDLSLPARILAAADCYRTATEPRPHRPARDPDQAGKQLAGQARRGALDADAVAAVLAAAGHSTKVPRRLLPMGLSDRECEVLGLMAQGQSNADIASRLVISRRTAEHHVQHIYAKIGVSTRAAATMFAVEHHLAGTSR